MMPNDKHLNSKCNVFSAIAVYGYTANSPSAGARLYKLQQGQRKIFGETRHKEAIGYRISKKTITKGN